MGDAGTISSQRAPSRRPIFFPWLDLEPSPHMSTPTFWPNCLDAFQRELTPQQYNTWIRPLRLEVAGDGLVLIAPNRFVLQWVKERFAARIEELAAVAMGRPLRLALQVSDAGERPAPVAAAKTTPAPVAAGGR